LSQTSTNIPLRNHLNHGSQGKRHHSTVQSLRKGHHLRVLRETLESKKPIPLNRTTLRRGRSGMKEE
jgi:hypothetical protein